MASLCEKEKRPRVGSKKKQKLEEQDSQTPMELTKDRKQPRISEEHL